MITEPPLIGATDIGAPLLVAVVRAEIGNHDGDAGSFRRPSAAGAAGRVTGGRQLVARAAPGTAP